MGFQPKFVTRTEKEITPAESAVHIAVAARIEAVGKTDAALIEERFLLRRGQGDAQPNLTVGGLVMTSSDVVISYTPLDHCSADVVRHHNVAAGPIQL